MKKIHNNPIVIDNVFFLGKGEVACSNHASSTILRKILSFIFRALRRFLFQIISCIFAVLLVLWCIGYALQMQFMELRGNSSTQIQHKNQETPVWIHH